MDISTALTALEQLASSTSTSSSGPLNALLDEHFSLARQRLLSGDEDPRVVITDLQKSVVKAKKDVEKGLKAWYAGLGNVGKAVEKAFPPNLSTISSAYNDPPLFSDPAAKDTLDRIVMDSLGRRGLWEAVSAMQDETGLTYDGEKRVFSEELHRIIQEIEAGNVSSALEWCSANAAYLQSPPHPSPLPYHLHRSVFLRIASPTDALAYARVHLMPYLPSQPVLQLITSCLYRPGSSPYMHDTSPLVVMFRAEYCRRHGLAKDEPLEVVVDLGSRGGALNVIEKARRVMGDRLGNVRSWQELPMEVPLPPSRRYHSVFVCPVSKEQATDANPPKMLTCGHVIAQESFTRLLKGGRRSAKCPYCPMETSQQAAQRLYF